jgi:hypothetical protein
MKKCIIICNGPSIHKIKSQKLDYSQYDFIAVNRWNDIFKRLKLPTPNVVIVGKNSLDYNKQNIKKYPNTKFFGLDEYPAKNFSLFTFGEHKCYNQDIMMLNAMWWSGIYAIQYAIKQEYTEIHIFGFTCTDENDYKDKFVRAPIPHYKITRIQKYFEYLLQMNILKYMTLHEHKNHPLIQYFINDKSNTS